MAEETNDPTPELPETLQAAIHEGDCEALCFLVEQNTAWRGQRFSFRAGEIAGSAAQHGKQMTGSLLSVALRQGGRDTLTVVQALVEECDVDMSLQTSHIAGSSRLLWSGPPLHDAICTGSLEIVQYMLSQRANPRAGSQFGQVAGATALWQASFAGVSPIVSLLLEHNALYDLEATAPWQDKPDHGLTPLHVAARMGHAAVVEVLIEAGAEYDTRRLWFQGNSSPLRDAIQRCHMDVVRLLVQKDATVPRQALFHFNNEVTISAVAEGLTQASREAVKGCLQPVEWLGMFLRTPGTAPAYILNAIFQSRSLKYFDYDYQRQDANMAHFGNSSHINVEEGISYEDFEAYFENRRKLGADGFDLLRGLGIEVSSRSRNTDPQEDEVENYDFDDHNHTSEARKVLAQMDTNQRNSLWSRTHTANTQLAEETKADRCSCCKRSAAALQMDSLTNNRTFIAPARVLQCLLPDVLNNEYVMYAIAHSSNEDIFNFEGCQAIISLGWNQAWRGALLDSFISVSLAVLFAVLTLFLQDTPEKVPSDRYIVLAASAVLVSLNFLKELFSLQGMFLLGKLRQHLTTAANYLVWVRIGLCYVVISDLAYEHQQWTTPSSEFSILLAVTVLLRWAHVLTTFRGYQWVGEKVLPIERALISSRMFAAILLVAGCAFTNAYIALGLTGADKVFDSFYVIYRLGFLSDLENPVWNTQDTKKDLAAVLSMISGLLMTVVMMNIFIGILSESYAQAYHNRYRSFQRERARIAFAHSVRRRAAEAWLAAICCCRKRQVVVAKSKYLWYSVKQMQAVPQMGTKPLRPEKKRTHSGGRRMSTIVRGLMLQKQSSTLPRSEDLSSTGKKLPRGLSVLSRLSNIEQHSAPPPLKDSTTLQGIVPSPDSSKSSPPSRSPNLGSHGPPGVVVPGMVEEELPGSPASPSGRVWEPILSVDNFDQD